MQKQCRTPFETSHENIAHDAVGGVLKHQADIAVVRVYVLNQSANISTFRENNEINNMQKTHFQYCESILWSNPRNYKSLQGIKPYNKKFLKGKCV